MISVIQMGKLRPRGYSIEVRIQDWLQSGWCSIVLDIVFRSTLVGIVFLTSLGLSFLICRMGTFTHTVDFIGILEQTWHIMRAF